MTNTTKIIFRVAALAGTGLFASQASSQTRVPEDSLPAAVAQSFRATFPKAKIHKVDVESENGVDVYDFEFKDGATEKEADIAGDGTLMESTVVVAAKAVPAEAMKAIRQGAKGAKIKRLEHIEAQYETKDGKVVKLPEPTTRYAAEMAKGRQVAEIVVAPDGAVVGAPEWTTPKVEEKPGAGK